MELEWWHWAVGGIALVVAELVVPSFVLIWFGVGALAVALMAAMVDAGLTAQLAVWLVVSLALVAAWFKVFRPNMHKTKVGMADAGVVGEIGMLVRDVAPYELMKLRLLNPILGADVLLHCPQYALDTPPRLTLLAMDKTGYQIGRV